MATRPRRPHPHLENNPIGAPIRSTTTAKLTTTKPPTSTHQGITKASQKPSVKPSTRRPGAMKNIAADTSVALAPARRPGQDVTNTRKALANTKENMPLTGKAAVTAAKAAIVEGKVATRPAVTKNTNTTRPLAAQQTKSQPKTSQRHPLRPKAAAQANSKKTGVVKKVVKKTSVYEDLKKNSPKTEAVLEAALAKERAAAKAATQAQELKEKEQREKEARKAKDAEVVRRIAETARLAREKALREKEARKGPRGVLRGEDVAFSDVPSHGFNTSDPVSGEEEDELPTSDASFHEEDKENDTPEPEPKRLRRTPEPHPFTSDQVDHFDSDPTTQSCGYTSSFLLPLPTSSDEELINRARAAYANDIDPDEERDIRMVTEYTTEIFPYLTKLELDLSPNPDYMEHQPHLTWTHRSILLAWLHAVHSRLQLRPETLFLTTNLLDRFLTLVPIALSKLQLVGITALFLAAKYEEVAIPTIAEMVYMVDYGYTAEQIMAAETFMLEKLGWAVGWPGPLSWLRRISRADGFDVDVRTLGKYFLEVAVVAGGGKFVGVLPSALAAAATALGRILLEKGGWTLHHVALSGYTPSQLRPLVNALLEATEDPESHRSVYDKYHGKMYYDAAGFVQKWWRKNRGFGGDLGEFLEDEGMTDVEEEFSE